MHETPLHRWILAVPKTIMHMCYNMTHENQAIFLTSSPFKSLIGKICGLESSDGYSRLKVVYCLIVLYYSYISYNIFFSLEQVARGAPQLRIWKDLVMWYQIIRQLAQWLTITIVYFFQFRLCQTCQPGWLAGGCLGSTGACIINGIIFPHVCTQQNFLMGICFSILLNKYVLYVGT